jgi:spermidine synthase
MRMLAMISLLFFLSGLSALVYEICLVRLLTYSFGHTVYAVTVILTTYMSGLALGSWLFGRVADRRPGQGLRYYALIEGAIGVYALVLLAVWPVAKLLERWVGTTFDPSFTTFLGIKFVISFLLLIPLTALMGGTLPLATRYITKRYEQIGTSIGTLYGINTIGGVVGTFAAGFLLIPYIGIRATMLAAFAANVLVCVVGLLLARRADTWGENAAPPAAAPAKAVSSAPKPEGSVEAVSPTLAVVVPIVAFFTGLASLGIEVIWMRVFSVLLGPTSYIFTVILVGFLCGLGIGSLITAKWLPRLGSRTLLLWASGALTASGVLTLAVYPSLPYLADLMNEVVGSDKAANLPWILYDGFRYLIVFLIIFTITTIFGLVLPLLMRANVPRLRRLGRSVGSIYAVNTVGAIVGSFIAGFVLLPAMGSSASSVLLAALILACAIALLVALPARRRAAVILAVSAIAVVLAAQTPLFHFANYLGDRPTVTPLDRSSRIIFNEEDPTASVSVMETPQGKRILFVDGILTASDNEDIFWNLALKGHLPVLFHPDPKRVLIVGLGAGITLGAIAQHDIESITAIEIAKSVIAVQDLFSEGNLNAHRNPNVRLVENDGRDFLVTTNETYDIITVDQTDPPVMMLYSKDFYEDARRVLEEDGIFLQWVPLYKMSDRSLLSIIRAFREVFPSVTVWNGKGCVFLMGTNGELKVDLKQLREKLERPAIHQSLRRFAADDLEALLSLYLMGDAEVSRLLEMHDPYGVATSDDRPIVEYLVPKERFYPPPKLRQLMARVPGDVRDILAEDSAAFDEAFAGIDFARVAKTLVLLGPRHISGIAHRTLGRRDLRLNEREFEIVRRYAVSRPLAFRHGE